MNDLNLTKIKDLLSQEYNSEISNIKAVGTGEWSQAFFFKVGDEEKVIRFSKYPEDFLCDQFAHSFSGANLPIPKIEILKETFGYHYAISTRVLGDYLEQQFTVDEYLPALLALFQALYSADVTKSKGFGGLDSNANGQKSTWAQFVTEITDDHTDLRLKNWQIKLEKYPEIHKVFESGKEKITKLIKYCPEERHLVHNDLLHFNVLVAREEITAVLDWGCAIYGDSIYDLATFITWQFYYPNLKDVDFITPYKAYFANKGMQFENFEERLLCYQLRILLDTIVYNAYKNDVTNLQLTAVRLENLLYK